MHVDVLITDSPLPAPGPLPVPADECGAVVEFRGVVRGQEAGQPVTHLDYEALLPMAEHQIRRSLGELAMVYPCRAALVMHRTGCVPAGEASLYVRVAAAHRAEAFALMAAFCDRLKQDVPIWKHAP